MDQKHRNAISRVLQTAATAAGSAARTEITKILGPVVAGGAASLGTLALRKLRGSQPARRGRIRVRGAGRRSSSSINFNRMTSGTLSAPTSVGTILSVSNGVQDTRLHFSYNAGLVYVGNGTLGSLATVYLKTPISSKVATGFVPIAPFDGTDYGLASLANFAKYFAQKRYNRIVLHIRPVASGCNVSNNADISFAPFRGGGYGFPVSSGATVPTATNTFNLNCQGGRLFPSWQAFDFDMTPFISSSAGTRTFQEGGSAVPASGTVEANADEIPCCFAIAGDPGTVTNGTNMAYVFVDVDVDLLDWTGGYGATAPELKRQDEKYPREHDRDNGSVYAHAALPVPSASRSEQVSLRAPAPSPSDYVTLSPSTSQPQTPLGAPTPQELQRLQLQRQTAVGR